MNEHLEALMHSLPEGADAALIESDINRRYYTGFPSTAGVLLVFPGTAYLLVDFRYIEAAREKADGCTVILMEKRVSQLRELFEKHHAKFVAIESTRTTVSAYRMLQKAFPAQEFLADGALDRIISRQRSIKTAAEYETMCRAAAIADRAFSSLLEVLHTGMTEREAADRLIGLLRKFGGDGESFETIAVSGPNSSRPHGVPGDRVIRDGDFLTLDFGTVVDGYVSDMTRTVAFGSVTEEMRRVYDTVLAAQEAAFSVIRPGVSCREVDLAARNVIDDAGYSGCFGHALGHSLGLEIHEGPNFSPAETAKTEAGMLLSVEPGIYLEGKFGVRIEDTVWITPDGFLNLAHSPKNLILI